MNPFRHLARLRGHSVWTAHLGADSVIVDAGAHRGEFSHLLMDRFACRCVLIEANPTLADSLEAGESDQILRAALSDRDGETDFVFSDNPEAGSIALSSGGAEGGSTTVRTLSLESVLRIAGADHLDLLKLDIEGAEFDLLQHTPDPVLERIHQLTIEFHDFLPDFAGSGLFETCRRRLESLGFECFVMTMHGHGDVLFLNRKQIRLSPVSRALLKLAGPWVIKARDLFHTP